MSARRFVRPRWLGPEAEEGIKLANALRAATLEGRASGAWCHVPNEGQLSKTVRAVLAASGLIPGSPDYWFTGERGGVIELKRPGSTPSALSPSQRDFRDWCAHTDTRWAMCSSADAALATLVEWGWLRPG